MFNRPAALLSIVFWTLHCLSFCDLEFLIIRLVLSNFHVVTNIQLPLNVLIWLLWYCMCWVGELYAIIQVLSSFMTQLRVCSKNNTIGATSEARKTYHSGVPSHWPYWSSLPLTILEHPPTDHSGATSHWPFWSTLPLTIVEPSPTDRSGAPSHWPFWGTLSSFSCVRVAQSLVFCVVLC